jgi:hypothetical protein
MFCFTYIFYTFYTIIMNKTKYNLSTFFEKLNNDWNYVQLKERFNNDAGIETVLKIKLKDGNFANVYSAGMWYILTDNEFANEDFIDAYSKGFQKGKEFIENKTNKAFSGFYANCRNKYIKELHYAYFFNAEHYGLGYKNGACAVPMTFYIDSIESIGFASGVVFAIDLMAKENPVFFDENTEQPQQNQTDEAYKNQNLFKVGLFLATGKMNKYFTINSLNELVLNNGLSPLKVADELQNKSFEKWILASKNNYKTDNTNGSKNIFNNLDMMTKIINHCKINNIEVNPYFISRLPKE